MGKEVDEKVVSLKFDNKNFEKNAKESIKTLKDLKESSNIGQTGAQSMSNLERSVDSLNNKLSVSGVAMGTVIQNLTNKFVNFATNAVKTGGINRAMNLEKASFQLEMLLKDSAKVEAVMANVQAAVDGTAYGLDSAALVASQLVASGAQAGDALEGQLRSIAGVAAMTGSTYEDIGRIYTAVSGQGRLMGDQLLQLSGRGVNAAATIAKFANVTEAEVRESVSKGEISFELFSNAMAAEFAEGAGKANDTLTGVFANVKSAFGRIGALFVQPIVANRGPLVGMMNELRLKVNELKEALAPFIDFLAKTAITVITGVGTAIKSLNIAGFLRILKGFGAPLAGIRDKMIELEEAAKKVSDKAKGVANSVKNITDKAKSLNDIINKVISGSLGNGQKRFDALTKSGYNWMKVQNGVNKKLGNSFRYSKDEIKALDKKIQKEDENAKAKEKNSKASANKNDSIKKETESTDKYTEAMSKLTDEQLISFGLTKNDVKAYRELETQARAAGMSMYDFANEMENVTGAQHLANALSNIGKSIGAILSVIGQAWSEVMGGMDASFIKLYGFTIALDELTAKLMPSQEMLNVLKIAFTGVFTVVKVLVGIIKTGLNIAFQIAWTIISTVLQGIWNIIQAGSVIINTIYDVVKSIGSAVSSGKALTTIINILSGVLDGFIGIIVSLADSVFTILSEILSSIFSIFNAIASAIGYNVGEASKSIDDFASGLSKIVSGGKFVIPIMSKIVSFTRKLTAAINEATMKIITWVMNNKELEAIFRRIKQIIPDAIKDIKRFLQDFHPIKWLMEGFTNGIDINMQSVLDGMKSFAQSIIDVVKDILGIHSPSTKFFDIAMNVVKGFANGIVAGFKLIGSLIVEFVKNVGPVLSNVAKEITKNAKTIAIGIVDMLKAFGSILANVVKGLADVLSKSIKSGAFATAVSNLVLAAVDLVVQFVKAISKSFKENKDIIQNAINDVIRLLGLGTLTYAIVTVKKFLNIIGNTIPQATGLTMKRLGRSIAGLISGKNFRGVTKGIKDIATAMMEIAIAIYIVAKIDKGQMQAAVTTLGIMIILIAVLVTVMTALSNKKFLSAKSAKQNIGDMIATFGPMLILASVMLIVAKAIRKLADVDPAQMAWAVGAIIVVVLALILLMLASSKLAKNSKDAKGFGTIFKKLSGVLLAIGLLILVLGKMKTGQLIQGGIAVVAMIALIGAFILFLHKIMGLDSGANIAIAVKAVSSITGLLLVMGILIIVLGKMKIGQLVKGVLVVAAMMALIAGFIWLLQKIVGSGGVSNMGPAIAAVSSITGLLLVMGLIVFILGRMKPTQLYRGIKVIAGFIALILGLVYGLKAIGNPGEIKSIGETIRNVSIAFILMAASIAILSLLDAGKAWGAMAFMVIFMGIVLVMSVGLLEASGGQTNMKAIAGVIASIGICCILIAVALSILSGLAGGKLVLAMIVMDGVLALVAVLLYTAQYAKDSMGSIIALTVMIGIIAATIVVLSNLPWQNALLVTGMLAVVFASIALVMFAAGFAKDSMWAILMMSLLIAITAGCIYALASMPNVDAALAIAASLAIVMAVMGLTILMLGLLPITAGLTAVLSLGIFIMGLIAVLLIIGSLMSNKKISKVITTGAKYMKMIGKALGDFIGGIISGIAEAVLGLLPKIALALSMFMLNLQPFLTLVKGVNSKVTKGAAKLMLCLGEFMVAAIEASIGSIFGLGLVPFAKELAKFAVAIMPFLTTVMLVGRKTIKSAQMLATAVLEFTTANLINGISKFLGKKTNMSTFAKDIATLGEGVKKFDEACKGINNERVKAGAQAGKDIASMAKNIPNSGGWLGKIVGENDAGKFGKQLGSLGEGIKEFDKQVAKIKVDKVKAGAAAGKSLAEMAKDIPNSGGLAGAIFGENDPDAFGDQLSSLGAGLTAFSNEVKDIKPENTQKGIKAGKKIIGMVADIPNTGGLFGTGDPVKFGTAIEAMADALLYLNEKMHYATTVDTTKTAAKSTKNLAEAVTEVWKSIKAVNTNKIDSLRKKLGKLKDSLLDLSLIKPANTKNLTKAINSIGSLDTAVIGTALETNGEKSMEDTGKSFFGGILSGMVQGSGNINSNQQDTGIITIIDNIKTALTKTEKTWTDIGKDIVKGIAKGINDNTQTALDATTNLAKNLPKKVTTTLKIKSPSRVFASLGKFIPMGLAKGIDDGSKFAINSVDDMTTNITAVSERMGKIFDNLFNDDLNTDPTIRPVIDLSNVDDGISYINSRLGGNSYLGTLKSAHTINANMNYAASNKVTNADVVGALGQIKADISGMQNNNYTINGVTYDDGSNIASAVETIVNAAKIKRRT